MLIHLIIGQRKEAYTGQYAPEVLDAADEFCNDENPEGWCDARLAEYRGTGEFEAVEAITVSVATSAILERLRPRPAVIEAKVV
jgi:hypothetical protein